MKQAYLTIDDSPSERFTDVVDFLDEHKIKAVFFCRGDLLEKNLEAGIYAAQRGHILGNHGFAHKRASQMTYEEVCTDIARCDQVLEKVYSQAGITRPGKYFRFAYMDRGMGPALCEDVPEAYRAAQEDLLRAGLGHEPKVPDAAQIAHKRKLQGFLKEFGYRPLPVEGVTLPWYAQTEMAQGIDSLCTYSTSDWAVTARHKGKHGFAGFKGLTDKIDRDQGLAEDSSRHIILAHDQVEIYGVAKGLIFHFLKQGFEFLDFQAKT